MTSLLTPGSRVLFTGDSITDADRDRDDDTDLGRGYAMIAAALFGARHPECRVTFGNTGIGGSRVQDLRATWERNCLRWRPDVVSILVGVNDTGFRYDHGWLVPAEEYERDYRQILDRTVAIGAAIVLVEPFLAPVRPEQRRWREDLDPKIAVVRKLAADYGARLVPADAVLAARVAATGPEYWCADGVHPTPAGHALLAEEWLRIVSG